MNDNNSDVSSMDEDFEAFWSRNQTEISQRAYSKNDNDAPYQHSIEMELIPDVEYGNHKSRITKHAIPLAYMGRFDDENPAYIELKKWIDDGYTAWVDFGFQNLVAWLFVRKNGWEVEHNDSDMPVYGYVYESGWYPRDKRPLTSSDYGKLFELFSSACEGESECIVWVGIPDDNLERD